MTTNLTKGQRALLEKTYFNPAQSGSFMSAQALHTAFNKQPPKGKTRGVQVKTPNLKQIQEWLLEKRAYTVHRPARKKYPMKQVIVGGVNNQLQVDLVDMQQWANLNDGFRYILLAIDCFSRYAYARPLKTKQGTVVTESLEEILDEAEHHVDRKIKKIQSDQGTEFFNTHVKDLLKGRHVTLFATKSPVKAQMVERLIRTLRSRQERVNTHNGKRRWIESFSKLVNSYNKTTHSSLPDKMAPSDVNLRNERKVWKHLYGATFNLKSSKDVPQIKKKALKMLSIGTPVRLSKRKRTFEKAYYQNWTDEIFFITSATKYTIPPTYKISDEKGELLEGIFYRHELTPVKFSNKNMKHGNIFAVENIVQEQTRRDGKKYFLVKWRGYPSNQNSWVRADQFSSITRAA